MNDRFGVSDNSGATDPNEPTVAQPPIFLPAPEEQQPYMPVQQPSSYVRRVRPEDLLRRSQSSLPANPLTRISYLWKRDPAYRVLFIAIGVVLLSSLISVGLVAAMFNQPGPQGAQPGGSNSQQTNIGNVNLNTPTPAATPTPIPTSTPTPEPTPTPTPVPTQPPVNATLTVQITDIPTTVQFGGTVLVSVNTSKPNVSVHLSALSNGRQATITGSKKTNDQGNATLSWTVIQQPGAIEVVAIAQDQQGHVVNSDPVPVQITFKAG
jgi:hypothetical protein